MMNDMKVLCRGRQIFFWYFYIYYPIVDLTISQMKHLSISAKEQILFIGSTASLNNEMLIDSAIPWNQL